MGGWDRELLWAWSPGPRGTQRLIFMGFVSHAAIEKINSSGFPLPVKIIRFLFAQLL